ncbi:MAG: formylglycine-generating enzyme family protein [Vibrio sp.]
MITNIKWVTCGGLIILGLTACGEPVDPLAQKINDNLVRVDGGKFIMGSDSPHANMADKPAHPVEVDSFYISKFEVTQALFDEVMGGSNSYFADPKVPVNNISWKQANQFIEKLNQMTGETYRLPTEAEWEYAAIGGKKSKGYTYSGSSDIDKVAWYAKNSNNKAHQVGQKEPNELGLYDMTGNVGELVIDSYDVKFYQRSPKLNPVNAKDEEQPAALKTVRGGSFAYDADESESYRRDFASQSIVMADIGLRLAKDAK